MVIMKNNEPGPWWWSLFSFHIVIFNANSYQLTCLPFFLGMWNSTTCKILEKIHDKGLCISYQS